MPKNGMISSDFVLDGRNAFYFLDDPDKTNHGIVSKKTAWPNCKCPHYFIQYVI